MSAPTGDSLVRLNETTLTVADPHTDVRERAVVDAEGEEVGTVDDLLVDAAEHRVRFLRVRRGGFLGIGAEHFLVPVDAVGRVTDDAGLYGGWGYPASWAPGYGYPVL